MEVLYELCSALFIFLCSFNLYHLKSNTNKTEQKQRLPSGLEDQLNQLQEEMAGQTMCVQHLDNQEMG